MFVGLSEVGFRTITAVQTIFTLMEWGEVSDVGVKKWEGRRQWFSEKQEISVSFS